MEKNLTLCFTGHRPSKLPWGYDEETENCKKLKTDLIELLEKFIEMGFVNFISGMALGSDMICAEAILILKTKYPFIKLECALPCFNQQKYWNGEQLHRYKTILDNADKIVYVSKKDYSPHCMLKRNIYMVDKSNEIIAIWSGKAGGTANTIKYALSQNKNVKIINLKDY